MKADEMAAEIPMAVAQRVKVGTETQGNFHENDWWPDVTYDVWIVILGNIGNAKVSRNSLANQETGK